MQASKSFLRRFSPEALSMTFIMDIGIDSSIGIDKITGQRFKANLPEETRIISSKVLAGTYKFTNYRQKLISKGSKEPPRELCIPTVRDKVALKALTKVLEDVFEDRCKTPPPQPIIQSILQNMQDGKFDSFIKLDIKRFYGSVKHDKLLRVLRRKIRKHEILSLIEKAISTPSVAMGIKARSKREIGLPEGLSISNRLANIYVQDIDQLFESNGNIAYYRYVDDVLILCQAADAKQIEQQAYQAVEKLSLKLHPDNSGKTKLGKVGFDSFEYLGYVFNDKGIAPRKQSVLNLERWIDSHMREWHKANNLDYWKWKLSLRITGCRTTEDGISFNRFGWLFYFSQSTNAAIPHKLDALLCKLAKRYNVELPKDLPTFSKSYYEIHYRNGEGSYIQLIDFSLSVEKKREILTRLYDNKFAPGLKDEDVDCVFRRRMLQEAKRLERDIGSVS